MLPDKGRGVTLVTFSYPGGQATFAPMWVGEGFPRDVHRAMDQWEISSDASDRTAVPVLVAHRFSSGTRDLLTRQRLNWVDETGRAWISSGGGLLIDRDRAASSVERGHFAPGIRWSPSTGAVAEELLSRKSWDHTDTDRSDSWSIPRAAEVADAVDWSAPQVSKIYQQFDAEGWTAKFGPERGPSASRNLVDPSGLLSAWAGWHRSRRLETVTAHANWRDPHDFVRKRLVSALPLDEVAFSGWIALDAIAPLMTSIPTISLYLAPRFFDEQVNRFLQKAGLRPVTTGARISIHRAEPQLVSHTQLTRGIPLVSTIRLYGDLLRQGVRGEDAAEHLRETSIGF